MKKSIAIIVLISIFLAQVFLIDVIAQEYYIKIVDVRADHTENADQYWIEVEYNLPYDGVYHLTVYIWYLDHLGNALYPTWGIEELKTITSSNSSGNFEISARYDHPVPIGTSSIQISVGGYGGPGISYGDTRVLYIEQPSEPETETSVNRLQIRSVSCPSVVEPSEEFTVVVEFEYEFSNTTTVSIGIYDQDIEIYLPTDPSGLFEVKGKGIESIGLKILAPPDEGVLHLSAEGYYWKDDGLVHGEEGWYKDFDVEVKTSTISSLSLTASADKPLYLTSEIIVIKGDVTYGSEAAYPALIDLRIHLPDGRVDSWSGGSTDTDGSFEVEYPIPRVPFSTIPPKPEEWKIDIIASYVEDGETISTSETLTVEVLPVYLKLHGVHLVQVIETPFINGQLYLAAGKEAGLRAIVSCPSLKGVNVTSKPRVKVEFYVNRDNPERTEVKKIVKEVEVGDEPTPVDFIFTLPEGNYFIGAMLDPDLEYMPAEYMDELIGAKAVTVKKMKSLKITFVPVYLTLENESDVLEYIKFCRDQSEFMKEVYPLPDSNFKFIIEEKTYEPVSYLHFTWLRTRMAVASRLNLKGFFEKGKIVGVLPEEWWHPRESGRVWPRLFKRAVLVKYKNIGEGVTSHEIGHTLGLNTWLEEYDEWVYPPYGKKVDGLILKNGKIFNMSRMEDRLRATGIPEDKIEEGVKLGMDIEYYCFMGNNELESWVCDETYPELFEELMDPPIEKTVYVGGVIFENGTVSLDNFYVLDAVPDPIDEGAYTIQCVSSTGEVLYSTNFGLETGDFFFGFTIPLPEGTSAISIKKADNVLKEVHRTPNTPTVTVQYPSGGEVIDGEVEIRWGAEDKDGDDLYYSVLYSNDGGETWIADGIELNETSCRLDLSKLPGGNKCMIRVIVTDGFNTGYDDSDGFFTVSDKTPLACIISPEEGETYQIGEEIRLQGIAYDLEDDESTGLTVEWSSNLDGVLGYGEELSISDLSLGSQVITLKATDSAGKTVEKRVKITVTRLSQIAIFEYALCRQVDQNGDPVETSSVFTPEEIVYSWLSVASASEGDEIVWFFQGPNEITKEELYTVEWGGEGYCYAMLDLNNYDSADVIGDWNVTVYVNGEDVLTQQFKVEEESLLYTILGLLILMVPLGVIVAVIHRFAGRRISPP